MNGRRRCVAALELEEPDVLPVGEINAGYYSQIGLGSDVVSVYARAPENWGYSKVIDSRNHVDAWGVTCRRDLETGSIALIDAPIKSIEDLEAYEPPSIDDLSLDYVRAIAKEWGDKKLVVSGIGVEGTFSFWLMGFERFITALYREPELAKRVNDISFSFTLELGKALIDAGVEAMWLGDDYAYRKGLFAPHRIFKEFVMPRLRTIAETYHKAGAFVIKHTDGDVSLIVNDMVKTGVDAIHPFEPDVMDIREIKELYGDKVCLWGNIDCSKVLQDGTTDQVRLEVRECIRKASYGGGHVLSSSHSLHQNVKTKNVLAMREAARKYGKYPCRLSPLPQRVFCR